MTMFSQPNIFDRVPADDQLETTKELCGQASAYFSLAHHANLASTQFTSTGSHKLSFTD